MTVLTNHLFSNHFLVFQSDFNIRLVVLEALHLDGEAAPWLESPRPVDEASAPQPDTTPKAPPRLLKGLEVASTSENTAAGDINAPFSLPCFSPLPPPNSSHPSDYNRKRKLDEPELGPSVALDADIPSKRLKPNSSPEELLGDPVSFQRGLDGVVRPFGAP